MEKKRKPGARKKSKPALVRQSIDPIIVTPRGTEFDEESDEEVEAVVQPKKRGRKPKGSAAKNNEFEFYYIDYICNCIIYLYNFDI
jgi:hypothetical protein